MKARTHKENSWVVPPAGDYTELQDFLAGRLGASRRAAKRLLDERRVFVNGRRIWMARHRLNAGDRVEAQGGLGAAAEREESAAGIPVLLRAENFWIVDKPAGLLSNGTDSVEDRLRTEHRMPELRAAHRLDRDTTGCLLIALTPAAFDAAVEMFRAGLVRKTYEAIVMGRYPRERDELDARIDGEAARTFVELMAANDTASLLRLRIETGRTHQIRRHLLAAGHPIAGDKSYGTGGVLPEAFRSLSRQMLHARELSLPDAGGGADGLHARSPLPEDFRTALQRLKLRGA